PSNIRVFQQYMPRAEIEIQYRKMICQEGYNWTLD
ncbi:MAG: hypothetical protein ACI9MF_000976, partial [Gammaproteobacteria bacterium]